MKQQFICDRGHRWELDAGPADATLDSAPDCPACGATGRSVPGDSVTLDSIPAAKPTAFAGQVPGYEILRELGRGGMGVVYLARQQKLDRLVALKMVLSGAHAGERERSRFFAEAGAVAKLRHPNIVQIHEIGDVDGRPYFSLEYVDGGSLAEKLDGTPLPAPDAAALMVAIARGTQAAHDAGVIHRDLKPANILLAGHEPKITDFGLAKSVGSADGPTQTGAILGTPSYMAPEQASGHSRDVGPAVDIYALGAILYELLTGRPPFRAETPLDTVMQVVNEEPVPPRQLQPKCPRDLDTIALKCLQKEPRKRYANAGELGDDLQRFLNGEPIRARPVGPLGRGWRWAKRNPAIASLLALLFLVMSTGLVVTSVLLVRADREHKKAVAQEVKAVAQEERAKKNLLKSIQAVDRMLTRVADERLAYVPQFEDERRQILEEAVKFYREFLEQEADDPELRREMGRAYDRLGQVFLGLGKYEQSREAFGKAVEFHDRLSAEFPAEARHQNELARSLTHLAGVQRLLSLVDAAGPEYTRAQKLAEQLVAAAPDEPEYRVTLAETLAQLGFHSLQQRRLDFAQRNFDKSIEEWGRLVAAHPDDYKYKFERAKVRANEAYFQLSVANFGAGEKTVTAAIAELESLRSAYPDRVRAIDPILADARLNLASIFGSTRRPAQAEAPLRAGLAVYQQLVADYKLMPGYRLTLARGYEVSGMLAFVQGKPEPAEAELLKATALLEDLDRSHPEAFFHGIILRLCYSDLLIVYRRMGRLDKALEVADKSVRRVREDVRGAAESSILHVDFTRWLALKGEVLGELKRPAEAMALFKEGLEHARAHQMKGPGTDELIISMRISLAIALLHAGDYKPALADADALIEPPPRNPNMIYNIACIYSLGAAAERKDASLDTSRREVQAEEHANRAIGLLKQLHHDNYFRPPARVDNFWRDTDLDFLRARPDFLKWAEENIPKPKKDK